MLSTSTGDDRASTQMAAATVFSHVHDSMSYFYINLKIYIRL